MRNEGYFSHLKLLITSQLYRDIPGVESKENTLQVTPKQLYHNTDIKIINRNMVTNMLTILVSLPTPIAKPESGALMKRSMLTKQKSTAA